MPKMELRDLPDWPRLLGREEAAAYLGLSTGSFATHIKVDPIRLGARVLYDRRSLDAYADQLSGHGGAPGWGATCELPETLSRKRKSRRADGGSWVDEVAWD